MTILISAYNLIRLMQRDFVNAYDIQTVEARDFTVEVSGLSMDFRQLYTEVDLKFGVWSVM